VAKFKVSYQFREMTEIDSRSYCHIIAEWYPLWIPNGAIAKRTGIERISGHSVMDLLWDTKAGSPKRSSLTEEIQYRFTEKSALLLTRTTNEEFKTVTEIQREKVVKELNTQIATQKVANVEVKQSDEGIVLSIENIQFEAESANLVDAEKKKLTNIGKMLAGLKGRKLNVVGHAANIAGSDEAELLDLSAKRAQSVADYLVQTGVEAGSIVASGMGGNKPLASNDTAEGRSKNRRVEIVIMDEEVKE
jgi:outer membrane protein OmpA-like peptidoglycan-associated protein